MHPDADRESFALLLGTGRCGSTMVSNLLRNHPDVLSLSEFFACLGPELRASVTVDGPGMWSILSRPRRRESFMLRHGLEIPEFLYPIRETSRFEPSTGVPPILLMTLPHLTSDYERLYEEMRRFVETRPEMPTAVHLRDLFSWLTSRFDKRVCVERSGGSLAYVHDLLRMFPDGRRALLVRDGRDCALSMSRHHAFRLTAIGKRLARYVGADPYQYEVDKAAHLVPQPLLDLMPETFDRDKYLRYEVPVEEFGELWSEWTITALSASREERSRAEWRTWTFEQILLDPETSMLELCAYVGADQSPVDQMRRAGATVVRDRTGGWRSLDAGCRRRLQGSCEPGFAALAAIGVEYG